MLRKQLTRKHTLIYLLLFLLIGVIGSYLYSKQFLIPRSSILSACTGHANGNYHYHARLEIIQDGKNITVPKNIGLIADCIHPVHTHDASGVIHIDYPKNINFTLGDLFDTQGIIFNDNQIGSIKTFDEYTITVEVNKKIIKKNYRNIQLKDLERIKIIIKYNKN